MADPTEQQKWHWGEGNKYAVEGVKTLLLLNGAAALAFLTYLTGKSHVSSPLATAAARAIICFSLGALFAGLTFVAAYLTQLQYGNNAWATASRFHIATYCSIVFSILGFVSGVFFAWETIISGLL